MDMDFDYEYERLYRMLTDTINFAHPSDEFTREYVWRFLGDQIIDFCYRAAIEPFTGELLDEPIHQD